MFIQRRFPTEFQFDLTQFDIRVREKGLTYSRTYRVDYEHVSLEPGEVTRSSTPGLIVTIALAVLGIIGGVAALQGRDVAPAAWALYGGAALLATVWYFGSRRSFYVFKTGEPALVVLKNRPSSEAVNAFLAALHEHRRGYLRQRYLINAPARGPAETIQQLDWLHQLGAISPLEHEKLKARAAGVSEEQPFPRSTLH